MISFKNGLGAIFALTGSLLLCASLPIPGVAQDSRGTVVGRVTDSTGAVIAHAEVRITNDGTGVVASASTNESGNFVLPYLIGGTYTISCEQAGFKKVVRNGIQIRINDTVEVNLQLNVGNSSEVVEVVATTPLLSTAEASLGQVVDERRVLELPQFAGNAMDLVQLAPGTINGTNLRLRKAGFNNAPSTFSTDGGGNYQNEFAIDGITNVYSDGTQPRVAFSPPQTSINEFKVQTSAFDASLGHTIGSVVNVSIKSGSNSLKGEMHEWFRNSALDSPTIFQNRSGQSPSVYSDNRYGASAGAPVYIPSVYNGKNRTFWFLCYEANKFGNPDSGGNSTSSVPTVKMHSGDLSELLALGATYQVYDPHSTVLQNGKYVRTPIPGNIIPASQIDKVGMSFMNLLPTPNQAGTKDFRNNFYHSGKALEDYWAWVGRIDHAFSDKHRLFLRFHRDYWQEDKNHDFYNNVRGVVLHRNNKGVALDDVYVLSPTFLMNARYGLTFQDFPEYRSSKGYDLSTLGFSSQLLSLYPDKVNATLPSVGIGYLTGIGAWESGDGTTTSLIHTGVVNFTKMKANHSIKFGAEYRTYHEARNRYMQSISPQFSYDTTYVKANDTASAPTSGGEIVSMLMGIPAGSSSRTASYMEQDKYLSAYIQDDWKVSPKLTVNLGLRYEYEVPMTERYNRSAIGFAADQPNPLNAAAKANYALSPIAELPVSQFSAMGGQTFAGVAPNGNQYWAGESANFQPRIGLAYQLRPKTIIRSGYGIFMAPIGVLYTNTNLTGFSQSTPMQASLDNGLTFVATNANPLPNGLLSAAGASGGLLTNIGQSLTFFNANRKHPYSQRWSFGVQHELPGKLVLEASYVGNRTTRANINRELNYTPARYLSTSPFRDQATIDFLGATFPNPYNGLNSIFGKTISRANLLKPYSEFSSVQIVGDPAGYTWYHSLQAKIERRLAAGWTVQGSYTFAKSMEATEFLNSQDPMPSRVISSLDRPHRIGASGIWEIPFGHKRKYGANVHSAVDFIAGGWQLGGIYQHQSGAPLGFGNRIFFGNLHNIVLPKDQRNVDKWFQTASVAGFETNSSKQLASNLRTMPLRFSAVRGPNQDRWDFSLIKNFKITERWATQFRAETFNALNHPNLYDPNTDPTSSSFGSITGQDTPRSWQLSLKLTF